MGVIYPKGILLEVSYGDCMSWMLLQTPVFLVWKQPPNLQMQTSLQTAVCKYRAQNIFYHPEHSQLHPLTSETLLSPVKARILAAHLPGYPEKFL